MKRLILTSSSGVGLTYAERADMVVPLIFRFVSGPLPTSHHLQTYLTGGSFRGDPEVRWSDLVARSPDTGLAHKELPLVWFCETYGVELIELWFDPSPNNQLQLVWILDYLRAEPNMAERLKLRLVDFALLGADVAGLRDGTVRGSDVTGRDFEAARMAGEAYGWPRRGPGSGGGKRRVVPRWGGRCAPPRRQHPSSRCEPTWTPGTFTDRSTPRGGAPRTRG